MGVFCTKDRTHGWAGTCLCNIPDIEGKMRTLIKRMKKNHFTRSALNRVITGHTRKHDSSLNRNVVYCVSNDFVRDTFNEPIRPKAVKAKPTAASSTTMSTLQSVSPTGARRL